MAIPHVVDHSTTDGHNGGTNGCVQDIVIYFGAYLGVELLGHMVTLCETIEGMSDCFPKWQHCFIFPLAVHDGSNFHLFVFIVLGLSPGPYACWENILSLNYTPSLGSNFFISLPTHTFITF